MNDDQDKQVALENKKIEDNIKKIKHRIVIFSGKGGVGKTMITVNLAYGLHLQGNSVGILDADVTGPNVPKMAGIENKLVIEDNRIFPQVKNGVKVVSMANLLDSDQAVIWRGPMRSKLLNQFMGEVEWDSLDYLLADLPPGTGDEILTMTQKMKPDLAIIITTPQEVSLIDSARAITMAKKMEVPRIALIENMAGLVCPGCGHKIDLFGAGGGERQAKAMNVDFFGSIPIDIEARELSDEGRPIILENKNADISVIILNIVKKIEDALKIRDEQPIFHSN